MEKATGRGSGRARATTPAEGASGGLAHAEPGRLLFPFAEQMEDAAWIRSIADGRFAYVNPAFERLFGISREQAYADPGVMRRLVYPDDATAYERFWCSRTLLSAAAEFRVRRADGAVRWLLTRSFLIRDASGEAMCAGTAKDITERKQAEQRRLDAALSQRDALVREVHHRIKNNLQGIIGMLRQLAAAHPELRSAMAQAITQVHTVAVIHGLQSRTVRDQVALCELVPSIAASVESLLRTELAVEVDVSRTSVAWICEAEAVPVALVLNELMFNAVKHCAARGGAPVRVMVGGTAERAEVRIVNPGRLPAGFDFARRSGVGVGLQLARSLLPRQGALLTIRDCADGVETVLALDSPVIAGISARWEVL